MLLSAVSIRIIPQHMHQSETIMHQSETIILTALGDSMNKALS